jgi:DNA-binding FrmR family transcriptional regulator
VPFVKHASHPQIVKQLKQAHGHLASILNMIAEGRSCMELAQQLQAVESIIHTAKRTLINDHMEHCIGDAMSDGGMNGQQALREFKALAKYL